MGLEILVPDETSSQTGQSVGAPPGPSDDEQLLGLDDDLARLLQARLAEAAAQAVEAIVAEVPAYRGALSGGRAVRIASAVQFALAGFIDTATRRGDRADQVQAVLDGAYALGRDEARSGRSMDALLAAYRVGARVSWRELAAVAVAHAEADVVARFAALVFAYIDELSAASVAGHAEELTASELDRRRSLERLAHRLLVADPMDVLLVAAKRANWAPPETLTVVVAPVERARQLRQHLVATALQAADESAETVADQETAVFLVPDVHGRRRQRLIRGLGESRWQRGPGQASGSEVLGPVVVGPAKPWALAASSLHRALRVRSLSGPRAAVLDTETWLVPLVTSADADALADLNARTFSLLEELRPATRARLLETLRSWLLHQGRREAVAQELFVHPQTVRYRMGQLRDLLGDRLDDPRWCEAAVVALASRVA